MKPKSSWLMCSSVMYTIKKKPFSCYNIKIQAGSFYLESTGSALNQSWANLSETGQAWNHKCGWCGGVEYDNSKGIWVPSTPDSLRTAAFAQYWFSSCLSFSCLSFSLSHTQRGLYPFGMVGFSTKLSEKERKPYLIQQGFGFLLRQQAQAGSGFQNHRCLYPLLFGDCLFCYLQQLHNGFSTLANGKKYIKNTL